eukprot:COSAG01_NODE_2670_length_7274_cov_4.395540_6_plen_95_part_00
MPSCPQLLSPVPYSTPRVVRLTPPPPSAGEADAAGAEACALVQICSSASTTVCSQPHTTPRTRKPLSAADIFSVPRVHATLVGAYSLVLLPSPS